MGVKNFLEVALLPLVTGLDLSNLIDLVVFTGVRLAPLLL